MNIFKQIIETIKKGRIIRHFIMLIKIFFITSNPFEFLKNLFSPTQKDFTIKLRNGKSIFLKSTNLDIGMFIENYIGNNYLKYGIKLNNGDTVIDFGANKGYFSANIANLYPNCKIFGYEPVSTTFEYLKKNVGNYDNVEINQKGVGDKNTKVEIVLFDESGTSSIIKDATYYSDNQKGTEMIDLLDVNDVLNNFNKIDLLKIDIEGAEWALFDKLSDNNLNKIKQISGEFHYIEGEKTKKQSRYLIKRLQKEGFKVSIIDEVEHGSNIYAYRK